ncbi:Ig-like domain-containing protein, partial [Paraburkholderia sp. MMS20-SJTN17]
AIQGPVGNGESTDDTQPTLVGKGEPGDTIVVIDNGTPIGEAEVDEEGNWSFTPETPLEEGEHEFTLVERDPAGNESDPSDPWTVIVDTTPSTPVITMVIDDVGLIQGPIENGGTTDDNRPTLVGKGEPNKMVVIGDHDVVVAMVWTDENGDWTWTSSKELTDGLHEFTVWYVGTTVDETSDPWVITVDAGVPAPVITTVIDDVGPIQGPVGDGGVTDDARPTVRGTAEVGSTVSVYDNGRLIGTAVADSNGQWSFTASTDLADGLHSLTATATNPATGNVSPSSDSWAITVDTGVAAPVITTVIDDVGLIQGPVNDGGVTDDARPTVRGTAEAGSTVSVYDNGRLIGTAVADSNGQWSFTPSTNLADGSHSLTATATNPATGNVSPSSDSWAVTVDTVAPSAQATFDRMGKDAGIWPWDFITNDGSAGRLIYGALTAKLAANEKVQVSVDGGKTWQDALTDNAGHWAFQDNTSHYASWTIQTRVVDAAGNCGKVVSQNVTLDTTAPAAVSSATYSNGAFYVQLPGGLVNGDSVVVVVGNATLYHYLTAGEISSGSMVFTVNQSEIDAIKSGASWGIQIMDTAGNASGWYGHVGAPLQINVDGHAALYVGTDNNDVFTISDTKAIGEVEQQRDILQGGGGIDTLKLTGAGQNLDLGDTPHLTLNSIEVLDITGTGNNTLKLSLADVLNLGGQDLFVADGRTQVMVKGNAGDKVELSDLLPNGGDVGDWVQQSGTTTVSGVAYDVFYHSGLNAELLVQHGVDTTLLNH